MPDTMNVSSSQISARCMKIEDCRVFRGPNRFSRVPMIQITLHLGPLEDWPTSRLPSFANGLTRTLPGLAEHGCSYGEPGGFLRRMEEGTWLGHVVEHVALELQGLAGSTATRGKTRSVSGQAGVYHVMYDFTDEPIALAAGRLALELVNSLLPETLAGLEGLDAVADGPVFTTWDEALARFETMAGDCALGPTTSSLVQEALRRGIPIERMDGDSLLRFGQGHLQKRIRSSCSDLTSLIATETAADKDFTKALLQEAGLPVPQGRLVRTGEEAEAAALELGFPLVSKPLDGNHGRGVTIGIATAEEVRWGFGKAQEHGSTVILEQQFLGVDHRILVVGGEVVAVAERVPAHVVGDGRQTIKALVDQVNSDPRRGEGHKSTLTRIDLDEVAVRCLAQSGLKVESVPDQGQMVVLRPTANLSTGGIAIDRTDEIHPENALMARRAAQIVGLDIAGIDFVCPDITKSALQTGGGIIEVNAGPGFRMHLEPFQGRPRNVARPVLELLFPKGSRGRIPIFAITGTNGKTTTGRMLAQILQDAGLGVGLTSTTGIYLNGEQIGSGDCSGPRSGRIVLREPSVEAAVLECARGGILREGLGFDECDVGAVLNVAEDHMGLSGVDTIEDLAEVKAVVVEAVRNRGWSILNADNTHTADMAKVAGGKLCYFSLLDQEAWPDFLTRHVAEGGRAINRQKMADGWDIVIHEDHEAIYFMKVHEIPATFDGHAEFNVANALAAIAMAHCHGIPLKSVRSSMRRFATGYDHSPGRLNVHDAHGVRIIMDYAHNAHGLAELGKLVRGLRKDFERVLGVVGAPGDRRDSDIAEIGGISAGMFDHLVFREDHDRRGRSPGEVPRLLREGALKAGCATSQIEMVSDEAEAVDHVLRKARPGDLVVVAADTIDKVWQQITSFDPSPPPGTGQSRSPERCSELGDHPARWRDHHSGRRG